MIYQIRFSRKGDHMPLLYYIPEHFHPDNTVFDMPCGEEELQIHLHGGERAAYEAVISKTAAEASNRRMKTELLIDNCGRAKAVRIGGIISVSAEKSITPPDHRCIDISLYGIYDRDRLRRISDTVKELSADAAGLSYINTQLSDSFFSLEKSFESTVRKYILTDKLNGFAGRLVSRFGEPRQIGVSSRKISFIPTAFGLIPSEEFAERSEHVISFTDRYGICPYVINRICDRLTDAKYAFTVCTDSSGKTYGVWIPEISTYIGRTEKTDKSDKIINTERFTAYDIRSERPILKKIFSLKKEVAELFYKNAKKTDDLHRKIADLYMSAVKADEFDSFCKQLLIDIFCYYIVEKETNDS